MSAAWVAGNVRARLLVAERRLGPAGARLLAASPSLADALAALARTPYRHAVGHGDDLAAAQRGVAAKVLVELRLLAGWLPRDALGPLRSLAAWFELANLDDRIAYLGGAPLRPAFELGSLATAWPRAAAAQTVDELRDTLAASAWGDPDGGTPAEVVLGLRLSWARRVAADLPEASSWAAGAAALLLAQQLFVAGVPVELLELPAFRLLGRSWAQAGTFGRFAESLPPAAGWALAGIDGPDRLWEAEAGWWRRVEEEAETLVRRGITGRECVVGAAVLLAADAHRTNVALAAAARRGLAGVEEVLRATA